jgi:hypothetical protein
MGRPLNKRYFGNFNIGTNGYTPAPGGNTGGDDGIGGEGVANVNFSGGNIGAYLARIPAVTFATPDLPGGVTATGSVTHVQAVTAQLWDEGRGYQVGDFFTTTGTGTPATWRVISLRVQSFSVANPTGAGNTNYDVGNAIALDSTNSNGGNSANWASPFVIKPITVGTGGNSAKLSGGTVAYSGLWTGTGTPPAYFDLTSDNTRGDLTPLGALHNGFPNYGGTGDTNATGARINVVWGIGEFELVTAGDYTAVPAAHTSVVRVSGGTPTQAAQLDVFYGVKTVAIAQKGSGYTSVADALPTFSTVSGDEVRATGAAVLTVDSGSRGAGTNLNVASNQDNAIIIHANTTGAGTKIGDIQKQTGSHRYKTRTADGVAVCKLVKTDSPAVKQAYITATDQSGAHYWVTKLTAHRAVIWPKGDGTPQYPLINGTEPHRVGWTFGDAVAPGNPNHQLGLVKIENA